MIFEALRTHSGGLVQFLLDSSLQITVLFLIVGGISLVIRRYNSNLLYWMWSIVVLRLCIPVHFGFPFGLATVSARWRKKFRKLHPPRGAWKTSPRGRFPALLPPLFFISRNPGFIRFF